ncbi:MAG: hypothetical protein ACPIOQ_29760, partial [Promethearchaeia archaeon]
QSPRDALPSPHCFPGARAASFVRSLRWACCAHTVPLDVCATLVDSAERSIPCRGVPGLAACGEQQAHTAGARKALAVGGRAGQTPRPDLGWVCAGLGPY